MTIGKEELGFIPSPDGARAARLISVRVETHEQRIETLAQAQRVARQRLAKALRDRGDDEQDLALLRAAASKGARRR